MNNLSSGNFTMNKYKEYLNNTSTYDTCKEKNACIELLDEKTDAIKICKKLGLNPKNSLEAMALIFKSREKSVSDIIETMTTCNCGKINLNNIQIKDLFFRSDDLYLDIPIVLIEDFNEIEELIPGFEDLDLDKSKELENKFIHNNKIIFNPVSKILCEGCNKEINIIIDYKNIISKFEIKNIFEQYLDITQFTNMGKNDVDSMLPFEREIFIGLIQERENKKG
jgi:hypothetical protein